MDRRGKVAWPSGLMRWIKAPVSSEAWVRIPPLPVCCGFSIFAFMGYKRRNSPWAPAFSGRETLSGTLLRLREFHLAACIHPWDGLCGEFVALVPTASEVGSVLPKCQSMIEAERQWFKYP